MAHYVSGQLPFQLPGGTRGVGQFRMRTRPMPSGYESSFFEERTTRRLPAPPAPTRKPRKKRRALRHGETIYCVYVKKKKISCSRSKTRAQAIANREKLKRAKRTGVKIRKQKYELQCPPRTKRVCKERKKGSRACRKWGCRKR